jgi:hypothetical protein
MTVRALPTRTKLEDIMELDRDPAPLVVVDFHVYAHDVLRWYEDKVSSLVSEEVAKKLIRAAWAAKIQRGPDMLSRHPYRYLVVADSRYRDTGNYWRDKYMRGSPEVALAWDNYAESKNLDVSEIKTNYKGTRGEKTDNFWVVFHEGWDYCQTYYGIHSHEGYEADDFAGAVYRASRDRPEEVVHKRQILLSTLDRDWSQLVDESHRVYFANTRVPFPAEKIQERLVGELGVKEHTKHRMGYDLDHPKNLAEYKVLHGDMGDNLPPGSPKCLFDLCDANPDWNIEAVYPDYPSLLETLNNPNANDRPDHYEKALRAFATVGIEAPIKL